MKCSPIFRSLIYCLTAITSPAFANGTPAPPPTTNGTNAESNAYSASLSSSEAQAKASAVSASSSNQQQSQLQNTTTSASASNQGNTQGIEINETHPRNAPALGQGSMYIGACGAGGNAGGSGPGGAGFLGMTWTPADCKLLLAAEAYRSIGMPDAACQMVNRISTVQKAWRDLGISPPDCIAKVVALPPPPVPVQPQGDFATREYVDRAFRQSVGK